MNIVDTHALNAARAATVVETATAAKLSSIHSKILIVSPYEDKRVRIRTITRVGAQPRCPYAGAFLVTKYQGNVIISTDPRAGER